MRVGWTIWFKSVGWDMGVLAYAKLWGPIARLNTLGGYLDRSSPFFWSALLAHPVEAIYIEHFE